MQINNMTAKVVLSGHVNVYTLEGVWTQIRQEQDAWLSAGKGQNYSLTLDASQVTSLDGSGFAFLIDLEQAQLKAGAHFAIDGLDTRYQPLLREFEPIANLFPVPVTKPKRSFVVSTGMATDNFLKDGAGLITFTGHLASDLFWSIRNIRQVRWGDFVNAAVEAGINALPIVGLVAFLIGVILSFQAAIGMQPFV